MKLLRHPHIIRLYQVGWFHFLIRQDYLQSEPQQRAQPPHAIT